MSGRVKRRKTLRGLVGLVVTTALLATLGAVAAVTTAQAQTPLTVASASVKSAAVPARKLTAKQKAKLKAKRKAAAKRAAAAAKRAAQQLAQQQREQQRLQNALAIGGIFTVRCGFSHSGSNDPIVMPGMTGSSHLHQFFGNVTTDAFSTGSSLLAGPTTCADPSDRSGYWVPALNVSGTVATPTGMTVYYRGAKNNTVTALPNGFKLVTPRGDQVTNWSCNVPGLRVKKSVGASDVPTCDPGQHLVAHVKFPSCWDGVSLDSTDHMSHVVYPTNNTCPTGHSVRIPGVVLNVHYPDWVPGGSSVALASGAASTMHGDVFTAWGGTRQQELINRCLNAHVRCGPARNIV